VRGKVVPQLSGINSLFVVFKPTIRHFFVSQK
jgi:hypothetical protein